MFSIRLATETDVDAICACDPIAQAEAGRRDFIQKAIGGEACFVAVAEGQVAGYLIFEYSFFGNGFVSLLMVHPAQRRRGVGSSLIKHAESICRTPKLFTSTNLSNLPMQVLLAKLEYSLSGVIQNLDEGDPELFYVKYL